MNLKVYCLSCLDAGHFSSMTAGQFGQGGLSSKFSQDDINFADFSLFRDSNSSGSDFQSFSSTPSSANYTTSSHDSFSPHHRSDVSSSSSTNQTKSVNDDLPNEDDFGEFTDFRHPAPPPPPLSTAVTSSVTVPSSMAATPASMAPPSNDHLSSLKALVMNKSLYTEKPNPLPTVSDFTEDERKLESTDDDWDPFVKDSKQDVTSFDESVTTETGWADFKQAPSEVRAEEAEFGTFQSHKLHGTNTLMIMFMASRSYCSRYLLIVICIFIKYLQQIDIFFCS